MLPISGHCIIYSFCFGIFSLNLHKPLQLLWAVQDKIFLHCRSCRNLWQILCLKAVSSSSVHPSTCRVACSAQNLGAGSESPTLTLQHAVDVQIFECAPEFLRSLNSGSCPLDGRSLVWKSQQVGRPWLTRA